MNRVESSNLADAAFLAQWASASMSNPGFWDSTPNWASHTAHRVCDGQLLVVLEESILSIGVLPSVVAVHIDGTVTLGELAEDLADAAGIPLEEARPLVAGLAVELDGWGAVDGVESADAVESDTSSLELSLGDAAVADYRPIDPSNPIEEAADPAGNRMVTEYLPDGSRQVTTFLTYERRTADQAASDAEDLAALLLDGRRSAAELVALDSCMGSKLRNFDHVPLVNIVCPDGEVRSVRCHDPDVAEALARAAGDKLAHSDDRGPIEVFVVTPLEGSGPLRLYDGRGVRRGRPRTAADAVAVVDELLGEATARRSWSPDRGILLSSILVRQGDWGLLVDPQMMELRSTRHALKAAGWVPSVGQALARKGSVQVPSALGVSAAVRTYRTRLSVPVPEISASLLVPHLVDSIPDGVPRGEALEVLIEIAEQLVSDPVPLALPDLVTG